MDTFFIRYTNHERFVHLREDYYDYRFRQLHDEHYPQPTRYWTLHRMGCEKFDIKTYDLIKIAWESPLGQKIRDYHQKELDNYLAFIGKTREQHSEQLCQQLHASVQARNEHLDKLRESEKRREREEAQARAEAVRIELGIGTWRYRRKQIRWAVGRVWHKFDVHVIFPVRCLIDREFREKWTRYAGIHQDFKAAQQEQFRRWDEERSRCKALNAIVQTTAMLNGTSTH